MRANLASFKAKNPGVSAWLVEAGTAYNKALDNPTAYGAPNNYCYAEDGLSCLWYNDYHPAIVIHRILAQEVADTVGAPWF
jgi:phospholipase/lecithinase/hemolysin